MNSMLTNPDSLTPRIPHTSTRRARAVCIFSAAALLLVPCLRAQSDAPKPAPAPEVQPNATRLYSLKFDGRDVEELEQKLKAAFPKDNVVIAPSAKIMGLESFEIRDVRLKELGRTIEFLSEGRLTVEVTEKEEGTPGNIWRIGPKKAAGAAVAVNLKMRSVAAPRLFGNKEKLERLMGDAKKLEEVRLESIRESVSVRGGDFSGVAQTKIEPLPEQKVFVLMGNEDGIAGVEGFIKAAEQLAVEEAANNRALAAALAPKMRAVLAPHLFASEERLDRITEEFNNVQGMWQESHDKLMQIAGINDRRGGVCVQPRAEQKLFVLIGSEEGIAGMESLIQAAEKNAADEDAQERARMMAKRAKEIAQQEAEREAKEAAEKAKKSDR